MDNTQKPEKDKRFLREVVGDDETPERILDSNPPRKPVLTDTQPEPPNRKLLQS